MDAIKKYVENQKIELKEIEKLVSLVNICNKHDQTEFEIYIEEGKLQNKFSLLYYNDKLLVGYLCVYSSYQKNHARITGIVHPNFRRNGIFSKLYKEAMNALKQEKIETIIFIVDDGCDSGKSFALKLGSTFEYSTYQMKFDSMYYKNNLKLQNRIDTKKATLSDIDDLVKIGMEGFGTLEEEERPLIKENLKNPNRDYYISSIDGISMGMIIVIKTNESIIIGDLVIAKAYRRKGYGRELLLKILNIILETGENQINLSVDAKNKTALELYEYCGFRIKRANNFYKLKI